MSTDYHSNGWMVPRCGFVYIDNTITLYLRNRQLLMSYNS